MKCKQWVIGAVLLLVLAACDSGVSGDGDAMKLTLSPANYSDMAGWDEDEHAEAFRVFAANCQTNARRSRYFTSMTGVGYADASSWRKVCDATRHLPNPTDEEARAFFEAHFTPHRAVTGANDKGLTTGYYEPLLHGSRKASARYNVPVYGVPYQFRKPSLSRAQIEAGGLKSKAPVLLYVDDPVMLFFLHIQGSGKVRMDNGALMGLQYAQQNGHGYVPIGRVLKERGLLDKVSMQTIRDWLRANPAQANEIMNTNPSYIFFTLNAGAQAAKGAIGVPLTTKRSVAVDDERVPYGTPIYLATTTLHEHSGRSIPFERLMVAQDTGGAIVGPIRYDIFFGRGAHAEWKAGHQNTPATVFWLLPNAGGSVNILPDMQGWF